MSNGCPAVSSHWVSFFRILDLACVLTGDFGYATESSRQKSARPARALAFIHLTIKRQFFARQMYVENDARQTPWLGNLGRRSRRLTEQLGDVRLAIAEGAMARPPEIGAAG